MTNCGQGRVPRHGMQLSERKTSTPVGLSRFLVRHRDHEGFETLRDDSLVTVICSGCEASFSYLRPPAEQETPAAIDEALARITGGARDGNGAAAPTLTEPVPDRPAPLRDRRSFSDRPIAPRHGAPERHAVPDPPEPPSSTNGNMGRTTPARRLAPPGPHAPRRRKKPTFEERVIVPAREALHQTAAWAGPRRRTILLTALAIAGAYLVVALTVGGDASSSSSAAPPAEPAAAGGARPLESFQNGGPDVEDKSVAPGNFAVAIPPDWSRGFADDGSTLFAAADGGGEVIVRAQPRGTMTYGQMTNEAATYLAGRVDPGTPVARPTWRRVGNLLQVAIASEPSGHSEIAYIGVTPSTRYLVVRSIQPDASALARLQADGIVSSLTAQ
jgi:hypothetical protein